MLSTCFLSSCLWSVLCGLVSARLFSVLFPNVLNAAYKSGVCNVNIMTFSPFSPPAETFRACSPVHFCTPRGFHGPREHGARPVRSGAVNPTPLGHTRAGPPKQPRRTFSWYLSAWDAPNSRGSPHTAPGFKWGPSRTVAHHVVLLPGVVPARADHPRRRALSYARDHQLRCEHGHGHVDRILGEQHGGPDLGG